MPDAEFVDSVSDADYVVAIARPGDVIPDDIAEVATVLECPNIVGTGMSGLPMKIAGKILNGTYCHVKGNEARLSTIHAVDVAQAVRLSLGTVGRFIVTDGDGPSVHDFAEALAFRINQKRIYTIKPFWAKFMLTGSLFDELTVDRLLDGNAFKESFDFKPVPVVEYLRTHVYDDESL